MPDKEESTAADRAAVQRTRASMSLLLVAVLVEGGPLDRGIDAACAPSFLYQPAYCMDHLLRLPAEPYYPQPGDLFLATDKSFIQRAGHTLAGSGPPHHSGIVFALPNGELAVLESGQHNGLRVCMDAVINHLQGYAAESQRVWVRRRAVPLTVEQSCRLTAFALAQVGKRFATIRLIGQLTPFRSRGLLRTPFVGGPQGTRRSYFCSELVMEACVAADLLDPRTTRPACTYPRDIFFGRSCNPYLDRHLDLACGWYPPARWTLCQDLESRGSGASPTPGIDVLPLVGSAGQPPDP
jgi:hypothetical protein